jgi:glycosyltransferase involved in cell wall biosynthesis
MKKLVIDARQSGETTGRYIDKLIEYLYKLNPPYEITVITKPHREEYFKTIAPKFKVVIANFKEFTFDEQIAFKKHIESLQPDLVHFGMVQQPIRYKGKVVTTMHDLTTLQFRFLNPAKNRAILKAKQVVYARVNKTVARKSLAIFTPSEYVKDDVVNYTHVKPDKITVTYESADKIEDKLEVVPSLKGKRFIMYIGRPLFHKNLPRLIEAFNLIKTTDPDLVLVLAGKKDILYSRVEEDVKTKGVDNIEFTGFVSEGQLRWLYENCQAYVFPSLSEGFGLPGVEAMIHGAPVVSSNYTCLPEVFGEAAEYFDPMNVEDIASAIKRVINDETLRKKLITAGYKQVAKYSWERMTKQTLAVYKTILGE